MSKDRHSVNPSAFTQPLVHRGDNHSTAVTRCHDLHSGRFEAMDPFASMETFIRLE